MSRSSVARCARCRRSATAARRTASASSPSSRRPRRRPSSATARTCAGTSSAERDREAPGQGHERAVAGRRWLRCGVDADRAADRHAGAAAQGSAAASITARSSTSTSRTRRSTTCSALLADTGHINIVVPERSTRRSRCSSSACRGTKRSRSILQSYGLWYRRDGTIYPRRVAEGCSTRKMPPRPRVATPRSSPRRRAPRSSTSTTRPPTELKPHARDA